MALCSTPLSASAFAASASSPDLKIDEYGGFVESAAAPPAGRRPPSPPDSGNDVVRRIYRRFHEGSINDGKLHTDPRRRYGVGRDVVAAAPRSARTAPNARNARRRSLCPADAESHWMEKMTRRTTETRASPALSTRSSAPRHPPVAPWSHRSPQSVHGSQRRRLRRRHRRRCHPSDRWLPDGGAAEHPCRRRLQRTRSSRSSRRCGAATEALPRYCDEIKRWRPHRRRRCRPRLLRMRSCSPCWTRCTWCAGGGRAHDRHLSRQGVEPLYHRFAVCVGHGAWRPPPSKQRHAM